MNAPPATASDAPDFLGIGAQRSATSWLSRSLQLQPGVWMPPLKELHFFDRSAAYGATSKDACDPGWCGLLGPTPASRARRWRAVRNLRAVVRRARSPRQLVSHLAWWVRFQFPTRRDDHWYRSLFARGAGRIRGEITPAYAVLEEHAVRRIAAQFPRLRIVFSVRDPIDRAVSQLRMHCDHGLLPRNPDASTIRDFFLSPVVRGRNDYLRTIETWAGCVGDSRFLLAWYEDIGSQPSRAFDAILDFLDVPPAGRTGAALPPPFFTSTSRFDIPRQALVDLAEVERPRIAEMAQRLGGHAHRWLAHCDEVLRVSK